ncbi:MULTISPECIES: sarcosine oxidase subunit gamma family protein [unclassified Bradyrhizobium]|uniref:sarcosine oxidase subunit gamma family protein n=1 Tax=unclassified Bradyrhizobium TaxID=2631580 RepID=UPI00247A5C41|nr:MULTISPECIES: sarcosine oxidase subunit gamma family protein [unclassified Bradyrhizobium]WGR72917.1 sarcosine oxidase subunit gamma [Bradyrhizobium sp. ISRA426]WGR77752.1 sarcosine oxidase subunit gamma [Bradyrhizobium sp. ISRA430]WGR88157.1 sarcosine oxidase subunit gamma [Bradyrhizobium sp. ISRA432]
MSGFAIEHGIALGQKSPLISTSVTLRALPEGHVLHVLSANAEDDLSETIRGALGREAFAVRGGSPGQCFVVGDEPMSTAALADIVQKLKPHADVVDQSHGRVRIAIAGAKAPSVLAKGTAVELESDAFPVGRATTTLIGHIATHVTRVSEDGFELMVLRGFAESLWDELTELSAEFR